MRAAALVKHGGPDAIEIVELPERDPGPGEVRLTVHASALNHLDVWVRRGWPGLNLKMPHVLGADVAGAVESVGPGVKCWSVGDPALVTPGFGCGGCAACLGGDESLCDDYKIYGEGVPGGMSERFVVPASHLLPMPRRLSFAEAAALPLTLMTAWRMLMVRGHLRPGETVLIQAAGSGVGSVGLQIASAAGARVIAGASSEEKRLHAERLGAHAAIDTSIPGWRKEVKRVLDGGGVDLVFEHVGGAVFEESLTTLRRGGRLVTCGATAGAAAAVDLRHLFFKQLSLIGSTMGSRADLAPALALVRRGKISPVVYKVLALDEVREAQRLLEEREAIGKVVLDVSGTAQEKP